MKALYCGYGHILLRNEKKLKICREMILKFVHENSIVKSNYIQQIPVLYLITIMGILGYKVLYWRFSDNCFFLKSNI